MIVAIDGPAGAGKSTIARAIAEKFGFVHIDTGAMFRAVALTCRDRQISLRDENSSAEFVSAQEIDLRPDGTVWLNGENVTVSIRLPAIASLASQVAALPGVRKALREKQRQYAKLGDVVMDGRDIGTVVFPDAELKIFLDADPDSRVERRLQDLSQSGSASTEGAPNAEQVRKALQERDDRDRNRSIAPLMPADDAVYMDTSKLSISEVLSKISQLVEERRRLKASTA
jgi:CMP/dCMP kinase